MRRHSRKGSLELSVNAIVVLVMAIAVLGLGLAFIRGALTKAQGNVFKAIDNAQLENPASSDKPATVDRITTLKQGTSSPLRMGFYNSGSGNVDVTPAISCIKSGETGDTSALTYSTGQQTVAGGQAVGFEGLVDASASSAGNYLCTVKFTDTVSTQFYITVTG